MDGDVDRVVTPKIGRLLAFGSGFENAHRVEPLRSGERLALSVWFTVEVEMDEGQAV